MAAHVPPVSRPPLESAPTTVEEEEERRPSPATALLRTELFEKYPPRTLVDPREGWVESLREEEEEGGGGGGGGGVKNLIRLHPDVWAAKPRLDVLWQNVDWQLRYRAVEYERQKDRYEMHEGPRPWPQKGTGRARHRSRMSPIWYDGGKSHPKRGMRGHFFMLTYHTRVQGLIHCLSAKYAQDDVRIVKDLDIGTRDHGYVENLIDRRCWGISALFVDVNDVFPANITAATEPVFHVNLMPCYGLNVHSMLKHKTLVLTVDAVNYLEDKLLFAMNRADFEEKTIASSTTGHSIF